MKNRKNFMKFSDNFMQREKNRLYIIGANSCMNARKIFL